MINSLFVCMARMRKYLINTAAILSIVMLAGCLPSTVSRNSGVIEGKTVFQKSRLENALVTALKTTDTNDGEKYTVRTDSEGEFRLKIPPGSYYLSFSKRPDYFGFFGGNPITVLPGVPSKVVLRGVKWSGKKSLAASADSAIKGVAQLDGSPVAGGTIQVFLDRSSQLRGPGYAMAVTDEKGLFHINLPPGRYFVIARQRNGPGKFGPLEVGDLYAYYPGNPVYLGEGQTTGIDLPFLRVEKDPSIALKEASKGSIISGTVTKADGKPLPGVFACLYKTPEPMGMPAFVSEATDSSGRFFIKVTRSGIYYLVARINIGRPLETNEYVAFYRGPSGHLLEVAAGSDRESLTIIWEEN